MEKSWVWLPRNSIEYVEGANQFGLSFIESFGISLNKLDILNARDSHVQKLLATQAEMATKIEDLQSQLHCLAGKKLSGADLDAQSNVSNTNKGGIKCKILDWFSKDEVVVGESDNNSPTEHNMDSDEQPIYNIFAWNGTDIVAEGILMIS